MLGPTAHRYFASWHEVERDLAFLHQLLDEDEAQRYVLCPG